jgi:hypothetical protein
MFSKFENLIKTNKVLAETAVRDTVKSSFEDRMAIRAVKHHRCAASLPKLGEVSEDKFARLCGELKTHVLMAETF